MKWSKISKEKDCIMFRAEMKPAPSYPLEYLEKEIKKTKKTKQPYSGLKQTT